MQPQTSAQVLEEAIKKPRSNYNSEEEMIAAIRLNTNLTNADLQNGVRIARGQYQTAVAELVPALRAEKDRLSEECHRLSDQLVRLNDELDAVEVDLTSMQSKTNEQMKDHICTTVSKQWNMEKEKKKLVEGQAKVPDYVERPGGGPLNGHAMG
ncbi:uncharacterized protein LTR77_000293 [Saxophila tyrrhenica]|uniref:Uncharacterized protein n=1 Tax=Saxophila tyrrhenica TaxID=1690608 RepID=A0AAV9PMZ0_9PEZI|nr:hypothetical protein LTR77_000293 [Saxophila tyrrhenica]